MFKGIISRKGYKILLFIILGIFVFFSLLSALAIYKTSHVTLSRHYGATYTLLTQVKESLIIKSIIINLIFYLLTAIGVTFIGIFYSHRIAGPLIKVKRYAAMFGEGRFDEKIRFRKKDAVHTLATELNEVAKGCYEREEQFTSELKQLEGGLVLLGTLPDRAKDKYNLIKKLRELDKSITKNHQKIKL